MYYKVIKLSIKKNLKYLVTKLSSCFQKNFPNRQCKTTGNKQSISLIGSPYFYSARNELLQVRFHALTKETPPNFEGLTLLEEDYAASIRDLGVKSETAIMLKNQAHILAFFLDRGDEAMAIMEDVLSITSLNSTYNVI